MAELGQLRDRIAAFRQTGLGIAAVSADLPSRNQELRRREALPFPLLSDPELDRLGSWGLRHEKGHGGADIARPAALLADTRGRILWTYQGATTQDRCPPEVVLERARALLDVQGE